MLAENKFRGRNQFVIVRNPSGFLIISFLKFQPSALRTKSRSPPVLPAPRCRGWAIIIRPLRGLETRTFAQEALCLLPLPPAYLPRTIHHITHSFGRSEEHTSELQSPCNLV